MGQRSLLALRNFAIGLGLGSLVLLVPLLAQNNHSRAVLGIRDHKTSAKRLAANVLSTPIPTLIPSPTPTSSPTPTVVITLTPTAAVQPTTDPTSDGVWDQLAACESNGHWNDDTGNGYYGGLQFSLTAWASVGGAGKPSDASRDEQITRAKLLQSRRGWEPWGGCSRKLGLY